MRQATGTIHSGEEGINRPLISLAPSVLILSATQLQRHIFLLVEVNTLRREPIIVLRLMGSTDQQENMSLQLGSAQDQNAWSEGNQWTINSFFSRVNYTFANKYVIEGTIRADGSSRFDPDHRWGWFPGVNAAWRVGEEGFMKRSNANHGWAHRQ